jgi:hypothetical protein
MHDIRIHEPGTAIDRQGSRVISTSLHMNNSLTARSPCLVQIIELQNSFFWDRIYLMTVIGKAFSTLSFITRKRSPRGGFPLVITRLGNGTPSLIWLRAAY